MSARPHVGAMTVVLLGLTAVAVLFGRSEPASACSCMPTSDEQALADSDAAFTGTLAEVISPSKVPYSSSDPKRFVFDVDEVFKGSVFERQSIVTSSDGASCGLEISGPGPFVVFASEHDPLVEGAVDGELYSNLCTGTRPLTSGDLPASFEATSPSLSGASPVGDAGSGSGRAVARAVAIGAGVALLGVGIVLGVRRLRHDGSSPGAA